MSESNFEKNQSILEKFYAPLLHNTLSSLTSIIAIEISEAKLLDINDILQIIFSKVINS